MKAEVASFAFDFLHTKRIAGNYVVSGPITALRLRRLDARLQFLGGVTAP